MATKYKSDLEKIAQSRTAIENSSLNTEISQLLLEVGYGTEKLQEGKELLAKATKAYDFNTEKNKETSMAYNGFCEKKKELQDLYRKHRRRAKVLFEENKPLIIRLQLQKAIPTLYLEWMDSVKIFYTVLLDNEEMQIPFTVVKISQKELQTTYALIAEVEKQKELHRNVKAESQEATKLKNKAIKELELWIRKFYSYAKIALEDQPQLLESLGKMVRS